MKKKPWKEDNKRFICFLDIMGFKEMVSSQEHKEIKKKLSNLSLFRQSIQKVGKSLQTEDSAYPEYRDCELKSVSFSDSIIFFTNEDKANDFLLLTYAIRTIFTGALKLGMPIKGAISYGILTANFKKSIFFGKPLINSYLLQEEIQYYGVVLDNHAEVFYKKHEKSYVDSNLYIKMKTPLKRGNVTHLNLSLVNEKLTRENLETLNNTVCGSTRLYVDNTISSYDIMVDAFNKN
jgi:hypothetical protein